MNCNQNVAQLSFYLNTVPYVQGISVYSVDSDQTLKKCLFDSDKHNEETRFLVDSCAITSRKHAYIILTPLKLHFYIVKLGFTGVYVIFLISAQKHRLGVLVRTASARWF